MRAKLDTLPEEVKTFVSALVANAKQVEGWDTCDMEGGRCFADTIPYVKTLDDGESVQVCDNYERFFDTIYTYHPTQGWSIRWMYADREPESYSYEKAMADAQIMFTG
jgi:hypothetical protein